MGKLERLGFLDAATKPVTETLELAGFTVEVRGLSIGELERFRRTVDGKPRDPMDVTTDLILECCFDAISNTPLIPESERERIVKLNPKIWKELSEAIARVNGFVSGNSKATDTEDSSSD